MQEAKLQEENSQLKKQSQVNYSAINSIFGIICLMNYSLSHINS